MVCVISLLLLARGVGVVRGIWGLGAFLDVHGDSVWMYIGVSVYVLLLLRLVNVLVVWLGDGFVRLLDGLQIGAWMVC